MDMPVCDNLSYITTPSHSIRTTSRAVSAGATNTCRDEAQCPEYSCLGPDYETIDVRTESQRKNQAQARLALISERYEYSEAHLATDSGATDRANYEVHLNLKQDEPIEDKNYSHLQH